MEKKRHTVFLGLGSNLGEREVHLERARALLEKRIGRIVAGSGIYATEAWGLKEQPDFFNQVVQVETELGPQEVLAALLAIEREMGRERTLKWGPRLIDIDLLFYDDLVLETPGLTIPHPFLHQRRFVLTPLREIAPELLHPVLGCTVEALWEVLEDPSEVKAL